MVAVVFGGYKNVATLNVLVVKVGQFSLDTARHLDGEEGTNRSTGLSREGSHRRLRMSTLGTRQQGRKITDH